MLRITFIVALILISGCFAKAQEFIALWSKGKMPNSKGIILKDSIVNERAWQIANPGMYAFFPSRDDNNGSAVVIFPGGGYDHITYNLGGFQLAKWFNMLGMSAFVVNYRLPNSPDLKQRETGPLPPRHFFYCLQHFYKRAKDPSFHSNRSTRYATGSEE